MRSFATEVLEAKNIDLQFTINGTIEDIHLDMEQRRDFFLIYKEAVNNIAKYAHCTKVRILLSFSRQTLQLKIEDNGLGFDVQQADTGNGLNNMRKRAENLGAIFSIASELSRGTTICLQIGIT
jgi:signal transduction histidine kinase